MTLRPTDHPGSICFFRWSFFQGPAGWFLLEPDEINIKEPFDSFCTTAALAAKSTLGAVTKLPLISKLSSSCEDEKMVSGKCHSWMLIRQKKSS